MRRRWELVVLVAVAVLAACGGYDSADDKPAIPPPPATGTDAGAPETGTPTVVDEAGVKHLEVMQVAMAPDFGCALLADGSVWCWGNNTYGELGRSPSNNPPPTDPAAGKASKVGGLEGAKSIAVGNDSACAILNDDSVWCWGGDADGELGRGGQGNQDCNGRRCNHVPGRVGNYTVKSVTTAGGTTCAVTTLDRVVCWGSNKFGQCGLKASETPSAPREVDLPETVKAVNIGYRAYNVCATTTSAKVYCWGLNTHGVLGHQPGGADLQTGSNYYRFEPGLIDVGGKPLDDVVDLETGETNCVVRGSGEVWCWGSNEGDLTQLPSGPDETKRGTPRAIEGVSNAVDVELGNAACVLLRDGHVSCWGPGRVAATSAIYPGDCTTPGGGASDCRKPGIIGGPTFRSLSVTHLSAGGVTTDGFAATWGVNGPGRLGHQPGTNGDDADGVNGTPVIVPGLP